MSETRMVSTFENSSGDRWEAIATRERFVLRCSDTEIVNEPIEIEIGKGATYHGLLQGVIEKRGPLDWTTPRANGWPKLWVMREAEHLWLTAFLMEVKDVFEFSVAGALNC